MSMTTAQDVNVIIIVPNTDTNNNNKINNNVTAPPPLVRTERRINPSWTVGQLKTKLEPITGIPASAQTIRYSSSSSSNHNEISGTLSTLLLTPDSALIADAVAGAVAGAGGTTLGILQRNSTLIVTDTRPAGARQNFTDVSLVEKYEMSVEEYEKLDDTVLAWKKRQRLGRFDPAASQDGSSHHDPNMSPVEQRQKADMTVVANRHIEVGRRCRVGGEDERRGTVRFVGVIDGLGGRKEKGFVWVGVELDEPVGRNDGTVRVDVGGDSGKTVVKRIFECQGNNFGVFARPEKIEIGDWPPLDDLGGDGVDEDDDMEEI